MDDYLQFMTVFYSADSVALLSMDLTLPFYARMGLEIPSPQHLQALLRSLLESGRKNMVRPDPADLAQFLDRLLLSVSRLYGPATRDRFHLWLAEMPFPHPPADAWGFYDTPFRRSVRNRGPQRFGHRTEQINREYRTATDLAQIDAEIESTKAKSLSLWDQEVYVLMKYNNDPLAVKNANDQSDERVMRYPFEPIREAIWRNRFQLFWEKMLEIATDEELIAIREETEQNWHKSFPAPRELRRQPWPPPQTLSGGSNDSVNGGGAQGPDGIALNK